MLHAWPAPTVFEWYTTCRPHALFGSPCHRRFQSLSPSFFRAADACLLVFNLCDVETFASLDGWWREMEAMCGEGKLAAHHLAAPPPAGRHPGFAGHRKTELVYDFYYYFRLDYY